MAGQRKKRKRYFIDKGFQTNFIFKFSTPIIAASLLAGLLIYYFSRGSTTVAFDGLKVVTKTTSSFILPMVLGVLAVVTFLVGITTIAVALIMSHRIVGPLYRLAVELDKIEQGDFSSTIRIRAKDQLRETISRFDRVRMGFRKSLGGIKKNWAVMKIDLRTLEKETNNKDLKKRIESHIDKIDSALQRFKTE
jgi:methyl-accepting chemotaxis protein